jgi:hypothetical protein
MYWENRQKPRHTAQRYLELSGIIDLRRHCLSIVSSIQHQAAMMYITSNIPALLSEVELWVQSGAESQGAEQRRILRDTLDLVEDKIKTACSVIGNQHDILS